jgi:hypothetical protein
LLKCVTAKRKPANRNVCDSPVDGAVELVRALDPLVVDATGCVITRRAADIRIIGAMGIVRRFGAALPIRIGVRSGAADEDGLLWIGCALLSAWAADAAAVGAAISRFVATGAVTHDKLTIRAARSGRWIAIKPALFGRGITADGATKRFGADRAAHAIRGAAHRITLVVGTAGRIVSIAADLAIFDIGWTLMAVRPIRAWSAGFPGEACPVATDLTSAARGIVSLWFTHAACATLVTGRAALVRIRDTGAIGTVTTCITGRTILAAVRHTITGRAGLADGAIAAFTTAVIVFNAVAVLRITMIPNRAAGPAEPVAATFVTGSTTFGADGAAVARLFLGGFVRLSSCRSLRHRRVVQVGIRRAGGTHVAIEPSASRICRRTGGRHIRQKGPIAVALDAIAGVVTDIVVVTGRREVDVAGGTNPVGDDVAHEALSRTAAIEFGDVAGVRHAIGTEIEISNWVDRLDTTNLAALGRRVVGHAVTGGGSQNRPWNSYANGGQRSAKGCAEQPLEHRTPRRSLAERTR